MNFVADLLWLILPTVRRSSVGSFVERDFFIRILFQVYFDFALSILISPFHSVVFTILQSERNFFLEKGLLSFQALIGELVV
jgi:hypothetical protein